MTEERNPEVDRERSDVGLRGVLLFAAGLVVAGILVHVSMWLMFRLFAARAARSDVQPSPLAAPEAPEFPQPRLQTRPAEDYAIARGSQEKLLREYGWVDRRAGVVRIPIERAMELIVARGLPSQYGPPSEGEQVPR